MDKQRGFTLIELMVVIGIIAILSAIGIPAYQNYLRKAALTDLLQTFVPYRTAIELCALDHGGLTPCDGGSNGIPSPTTTRYLSAMSVANGSGESERTGGHPDADTGQCRGRHRLAARLHHHRQ